MVGCIVLRSYNEKQQEIKNDEILLNTVLAVLSWMTANRYKVQQKKPQTQRNKYCVIVIQADIISLL